MPGYFLDTSALVKRYRVEAGTPRIDEIFAESDSRFAISRIGLSEAVSALAMRVRMAEISIDQFQVAHGRLMGDVAARSLIVTRVLGRHFQMAESLLVRHAPYRRLRTLDAVQLAVALDLAKIQVADRIVSADQSLCEIAVLEGLPCVNPLQS